MTQSTDDLVKRITVTDILLDQMLVEAESATTGPITSAVLRKARDTIERLQADLAARDKTIETLRENAERWRWVRGQLCDCPGYSGMQDSSSARRALSAIFGARGPDEIDAAIDAARSEESKTP